jgi:glycosyltransferase involved in cell wall biosynthesis
MKIAVIGSKGLPPRQGGIEHHCAEIYPRIAAEGHTVKLFARSSYSERGWNARYHYKNIEVTNIPSIPVRGIDAFSNSAAASLMASLGRFDIVHFHALGPAMFSWLPRLLSSHTKVVVTCHGLDWQRSKWGKTSTFLLKLGERIAVKFAHEIAVVSEDLQHYFWDKYNRQTSYIANAPASYTSSDPDFTFGQAQGLTKDRYIVFLGRLVPEKRPDILIKAFKQLPEMGWKLILIGGGSDTPKYTDYLKSLVEPDPNIILGGELLGSRLAEVMRGAGLFVLPSQLEGQPLALLEAMQEGIPSVASDISVHRRLLGDERGVLFEEGSVGSCATALTWATQNLEAMRCRADKAKEYIHREHNWDYIAEDWIEAYQRLLGLSTPAKIPALVR